MIRKLLFALAVLLTAGLASAQPNLNYSFARDNQGVPIIGRGLRPTVTGEMGIPIGTPFFDTTDNSLYYWSGSAWTSAAYPSAVLLPDGTVAAPGLAFSSESALGLYRTASGTIGFSLGAVGRPQIVMSYGNNTLQFVSTAALAWNSGSSAVNGTNDVLLARDAAATLQVGADAASAVSQTFKGSDSTGNGTAGGVLTIRGGAGTAGDAKGGNLNLAGGAAFGAGEQGVVAIVDTGTKPTCTAGLRGGFWYEQGGAGVADTFEVCAKAAAGDTYAWRTLATIP